MGIYEKTMIKGDAVLELIPQRAPIVMVDGFLGMEGERSFTTLTVDRKNMFCADDCLQEPGVIEHIAQSAAARLGFICRKENRPVPLGYIGAVTKLTLYRLPVIGEELQTEVRSEQEIMGLHLISARVVIEGELIAECMMKIFIQKA